MLSSILFSLPLLVASAVASPTWGPWQGKGQAPACLTDSDVNTLINGYTYLLRSPQGADFNSTANSLLSDSFYVSSDSINSLAGIPVRFPLCSMAMQAQLC